jgi:hypothetical protein
MTRSLWDAGDIRELTGKRDAEVGNGDVISRHSLR